MSRRFRRLGDEVGGNARSDGRPLHLMRLDGPVARDQAGQAGEHRRKEEQKFQSQSRNRTLTGERHSSRDIVIDGAPVHGSSPGLTSGAEQA